MDEATARSRLESMVAHDSVPTLDATQITELLDLARRPDADGLAPTDTGWTETWDLNAAAAEGWRWKAAKVAGYFTFGTDGQTFNRSDMAKACQDMARTYRDRVVGSIPTVAVGEWDTDIAGNTSA